MFYTCLFSGAVVVCHHLQGLILCSKPEVVQF